MTKPFDRVLTTLTYIRGPMINNWVNSQEEHLACYNYAEKGLDSVVMTTWAESSISHGLIVRVVLKGADVVPCLIVWK
jgi:hypothetical protein